MYETYCYLYNQTSCPSGYSIYQTYYNYSLSVSSSSVMQWDDLCKNIGTMKCNSPADIGTTSNRCSDPYCNGTGYTLNSNNICTKKVYSCSTGSLSGTDCILDNQTSQVSGWSCTPKTYSYGYIDAPSQELTNCTPVSLPACSSSNNGTTYIKKCTAKERVCKTNGYTKLNDSWCYKNN